MADKENVADEPCDTDQTNPVDASAETWLDVYANTDDPEDFLDRDHAMDG